MREIVLDTETTGLDPGLGHRVVEIGAVELVNHVATGEVFHCYLDPERDMPAEAFAVHGLSSGFLTGKPRFAEIAAKFLKFIGASPLVIHNAAFDLGFLNAELLRAEQTPIVRERCIDTLEIARRNFPGAPANLDALCRRYQIDLSDRLQHGALKDARLLAAVYLELLGGREPALSLVPTRIRRLTGLDPSAWTPKLIHPTPAESKAHKDFLARMPAALWHTLDGEEIVAVAVS